MVENPPAFPVPEVRDANGCGIMEGSPGMTLRDWFAGQALAATTDMAGRHPRLLGWSDRELAEWVAGVSYTIADAMLAARTEPQP